MEHYKHSKTPQFRSIVKEVRMDAAFEGLDAAGEPIYNKNKVMPTKTFYGTVKLHGTNAGIVYDTAKKELYAQGRNKVLTVGDDNFGFATWVHGVKNELTDIALHISKYFEDGSAIIINGEWAGKNVQKGVGISAFDKAFYMFSIVGVIDGIKTRLSFENLIKVSSELEQRYEEIGFFSIVDFPTYVCSIDFNNPEAVQNSLIAITEAVEENCPVTEKRGANGIGEGVVWFSSCGDYFFKVKGEKHAVSKVKTLAPIDVEKLASIEEFVDYAVTVNRMEQGIQEAILGEGRECTMQNVKYFLKWVMSDIATEEADTLAENGLTMKEVSGKMSKKAVTWYGSLPILN
jgi:hypothetical protein